MHNGKHNAHDWGLLLIRLGLAAVFLTHGISKFQNLDQTTAFFGMLGLSAFWVYLVATVETLGGAAMLLGYFSRFAGALLAVVMVVAIALAKWKMGFLGGYELDLTLLLAALGIAFAGPGTMTVTGCKECFPKKEEATKS